MSVSLEQANAMLSGEPKPEGRHLSLEEANAQLAHKPQKRLTLEQANAQLAPKKTPTYIPPDIPKFILDSAQPLTGFMEQYQKNIKASTDLISSGLKDISLTSSDEQVAPLVNIKGVGKSALGLVQLLWSPAQTVVDQFASKPTAAVVSKIGESLPVKEPEDKPPGWDAAMRAGKTPPKFKGTTLTREDVTSATDYINDFMGNLYSTAAGFIGGQGAVNPKIGRAALEELHPTDKAAFKKNINTAFDELVTKSPVAANAIVERIKASDPELAAALKRRMNKEVSVEEAKIKGKDIAKPRVRVVGTTAEGKPRVRVMTTDEAGSKVRDAMKDANEAVEVKPKEAPKDIHPYILQADRNAMGAEWVKLHAEVEHIWDVFTDIATGVTKEQRGQIGTHMVLDHIITHAPDGPLKDMLSHLRQYIQDRPIVPEIGSITSKAGNVYDRTAGIYDPLSGKIHIRVENAGYDRTRALIHEMIHAATSDFLETHPDHPLVIELQGQLNDARASIAGLSKELGITTGDVYGLQDLHEFMAEAKTRPSFQELLLKSGTFRAYWGKLQDIAVRFGQAIGRLLGITNKNSQALLNNILQTTDNIMAAQKEMGEPEWRAREQLSIRRSEEEVEANEEAFTYKPITPRMSMAVGKLEGYIDEIKRTFNPEALGPEAKTAAATIAKEISKQMQSDSFHFNQSAPRRKYWNKNLGKARDFLANAERGIRMKDPMLEKGRRIYERWNQDIAKQDKEAGFTYDEVDHYMAHIFEDGKKAVAFAKAKFGKKWGDPAFIKNRTFDMYEEARKNGLKPKSENPEDIMLMRQHASDVSTMKVNILRELDDFGIAKKMTKEDHEPPDYPATQWRAPNGDWYWVHDSAYAVMENAFNTQSLWNMKGIRGDAFRGAMALKNKIVPIKLAFSLFHPLHVATIDNATSMVRASKEMLAGSISPVRWAAQMVRAATYPGVPTSIFQAVFQGGSRELRAWQGKMKATDYNSADRQALTYMFEGGLIPEMSAEYRSNSKRLFMDAVQKGRAVAVFHAPFAALEAVQGIMFEKWIPSLKIASYMKDVESALRADPSLIDNPQARQLAFRKIAKSIDNRYGEMAYNTLFWNKMAKDLAVANTLSLGWQLGFIREYGGAVMDIGQGKGGLVNRARKGMLDRPMFVLFYSTQALAYGGLMTYAMTGKAPKDLIDYLYPQTGGQDKNGKPNRATTMFYPREFYAISKHIQNEGVMKGVSDTVQSKASGLVGMAAEGIRGVNSFGDQIRDSNDPAYKQLEETLTYVLKDMLPITYESIKRGPGGAKGAALAVAGFSPAPKYITDSPTEGRIKALYDKTYAQRETPYMQAQKSQDVRAAKEAYMTDSPKYDEMMAAIKQKFDPKDLDPKMEAKLEKAWEKEAAGDKPSSPTITMFKRMSVGDQQALLDQMTPQEREIYLPVSNKTYLRDNYVPPEKRK